MANATSKMNDTQNKDKGFGKSEDTSLRGTLSEVVGSDKVEAIRDTATQGLTAARNAVGEYATQAKDFASEYAGELNTYVRRYPVPSILVGFGVGILLGALISPRRY